MINNVTLVGRLTRDPDLRVTQSGKAVAGFVLAVNRKFKNASGEREADFISCIIWGKSAENLSNWARKGTLIGITGSIQTRTYDKDGQTVYVTEVNANSFQVLESKNQHERMQNGNAGYDSPFGNTEPMDIQDDDLPF